MSVNLSPFPSFPILGNTTFTHPGTKIDNAVNCIDLHGRTIQSGMHYVPGPDECTLCVCDEEGGPIWCKAVLCSPPQDCKSFRVGNSCCEFICLDDTIRGKGGNGGPFGPIDNGEVVPKIVIASVCSMLSLALLSFLVYRLRQRHVQGRFNSAEACHSAQMCDECDDTNSLNFSNDCYFERPGVNSMSNYFPPHYLWKPPSHYFPPSGEAPPPYEIACATTSNCFMQLSQPSAPNYVSDTNALNVATTTTTTTVAGMNSTILTNENINQVPNSIQNPQQSQNQTNATTTNSINSSTEPQISNGSTSNTTSSDTDVTEIGSERRNSHRENSSTRENATKLTENEQQQKSLDSSSSTTSGTKIRMTDANNRLGQSMNTEGNEIIIVHADDPLQGPSQAHQQSNMLGNSTSHDRSIRNQSSSSSGNSSSTTRIIFNPHHHHQNHHHHRGGRSSTNVSHAGANPAVQSLLRVSSSDYPHPPSAPLVVDPDLPPYSASFRDCFRHSLTLPRHPRDAIDFGMDLDSEEYARRQRLSLQFNLADWSSASSSTLSLSTPNTPLDRPDSSSSSSS